jgi:hypothetical protein
VDDLFYFFMRLRKPRIRAVVERVRQLHPDASVEEHARLLIESHAPGALLAGALFQAPLLVPGVSKLLRVLGVAGGASVLTRSHLYLLLELALLYGKDIDDVARVPEMAAVIAATGASVAAPPLVLRAIDLPPTIAIPLAGLSASATTRLIGEIAIKHYSGALKSRAGEAPPPTAPA